MIILIVAATVLLACVVAITVMVILWTSRKSYWYESILDAIPFPISVTDKNMKWTFVNKPVEQMLNSSRAELMGKQCSSWGAGICNTEQCGINCLRRGVDVTNFSQAGMDFQVNTTFLKNAAGNTVGHIEVVQDISKTVKTQKAQAILVERIGEVSGAFTQGSRQIADGAQALAQGSTQQAAAVEELSSSISEIAKTTRTNAELADKAANLSNTIKHNAEKGSRQMSDMVSAVKEINDASQGINNVIKVIDDIAFQTNILALNAAVEAARAGQHGKGFAVVAEEVRNLASKSSEAAKETGSMIVNSIEKAELGSRIATETSASLNEIVLGINESTQLVDEIARSSGKQSAGLERINTGIGQVSQVVQQNSATAQQSAASSQELSEQARALEELLERFESETGTSARGLSGSNAENRALPSGRG